MNRLLAILIPLVLAMSAMAQSQQPCRFCDTLTPYKHSIMIQVNRGFEDPRDIATYIREKTSGLYNEENDVPAFIFNIRYAYRVLPYMSVGPEFIYATDKHTMRLQEYDENQNMTEEIFKLDVSRTSAGAFSRLHGNWLQVFKPYADIGLGYYCMHSISTPKNPQRTDLLYDNKYHRFYFYIAPGFSFMIWKNHFSIDIGVKYSPTNWHNIFSKKVVFTWKIGYNFNSQNKKK